MAVLLGCGIAGFWVLNFPLGLIFLGDAGAYIIGMTLGWLGVITLVNGEGVAPWSILLALFWPIADMTLAIWRRAGRNTSAMQPDRLHMHQLVMRTLNIYIFGKKKHTLSNPLTTLLLSPSVIMPPICATLLWDKQLYTFGLVLVFGVLFFLSYLKLLAYVKLKNRRV
jgi:UDP-N-acetylmuramyl pentapeptide phosphotransferase/UDP-N-acetylglucosamine-1-phosphate transferase